MPASFYRASVALLAIMIAVPTPVLAQETKVLPESHEQLQLSFAPLVKRTASAVVNVYAERIVERRSPIFDDPFFQQFFGGDNPFGARLQPVFSSDLAHWDVEEMDEVVAEAFGLVRKGVLEERDFREFVFENPARLLLGQNPDIFVGTAVEAATAPLADAARAAQAGVAG